MGKCKICSMNTSKTIDVNNIEVYCCEPCKGKFGSNIEKKIIEVNRKLYK